MAYVSPTDPSVGEPTKNSWAVAVGAATDFNNAAISSRQTGLINGSFENLTGAIGSAPVEWDITPGGDATFVTTETEANVRHGRYAAEARNVNLDGETIDIQSSSYTPCAPAQTIDINFYTKAENAATTLKLEMFWYYWTGSAFSAASTASTPVVTITTMPTTWERKEYKVAAPAGEHVAEFYKLKVTFGATGGSSDTYDMWLDGIESRVFKGFIPTAGTNPSLIAGGGTSTRTYGISSITLTNSLPVAVSVIATLDVPTSTSGANMIFKDSTGGTIYHRLTDINSNVSTEFTISASAHYLPLSNNGTEFVITTSLGSTNLDDSDVWVVGYHV